jgi:hypothetical protein
VALNCPIRGNVKRHFFGSLHGDADALADIQPRLSMVVFWTRLGPHLLCNSIPMFHEAVAFDASRFLKLHKRRVG